MRRFLVGVLLACLALGAVNALILWGEGVGLGDAIHGSLSLLVAGDQGVLEVRQLRPLGYLATSLLMLSGVVLTAVAVGLVTDAVLRYQLERLLGKRGLKKMKDHIILVGLGRVGWNVLQTFDRFGRPPVLAIEKDPAAPFLDKARRGFPWAQIVVDDAREQEVLVRAGAAECKAVICATDDDLTNLEAALNARELQPGVRVVLRMYDQHLARKVQGGFGIHVALSSSALAAPAFCAAAVDMDILSAQDVEGQIVVTARVEVQPGTPACGLSTGEFQRCYGCSVIKIAPAGGSGELFPPERPIAAGDRLIFVTRLESMERIEIDAEGERRSLLPRR